MQFFHFGLYGIKLHRIVFSGAETVLSHLVLYQSFTTALPWLTKNMIKARIDQLPKKPG